MKKVNFQNNGQPAINDTNLNQMQDNIEEAIEEISQDTGWINGTTIGNETNNQVRYRKVGNIVYISSMVYLSSAITISGMTTYPLFTLPDDCKPQFGIRDPLFAKGPDNVEQNHLMYQISSDGKVGILNSTNTSKALNCFYFNTSYPV